MIVDEALKANGMTCGYGKSKTSSALSVAVQVVSPAGPTISRQPRYSRSSGHLP